MLKMGQRGRAAWLLLLLLFMMLFSVRKLGPEGA